MTRDAPEFRYEPSPQHKWGTTEAGPPKWNPYKERCPADITATERGDLLRRSVSRGEDPADPRRWAVRRTEVGVEFYESKLTLVESDGTIVVHGHPTCRVPPKVLRHLRDNGEITKAEYERFRKELNG